MSRALQGLYFLPYMALLSGFHWLTVGSLASNPRQCCSWQSPVKIHSNTWRAVISQINHLDKFHCTLPCVIDNLQRREELGQLCETKVVQPDIRWKCEPQQLSLIKLKSSQVLGLTREEREGSEPSLGQNCSWWQGSFGRVGVTLKGEKKKASEWQRGTWQLLLFPLLAHLGQQGLWQSRAGPGTRFDQWETAAPYLQFHCQLFWILSSPWWREGPCTLLLGRGNLIGRQGCHKGWCRSQVEHSFPPPFHPHIASDVRQLR